MNRLILLLFWILVFEGKPLYSATAQPNEKQSEAVRIEKAGFNKSSIAKMYEMSISYPVIYTANQEVEHLINVQLQRIMAEAVSEFKRKLNRLAGNGQTGFSFIRLDYDLQLTSAEVISIRFIQESLLNDGKAKGPTKLFLTYNFLVKTGERLTLTDLFLPDIEEEKEILAILRNKLGKCKVRPDYLTRNFCFTKEGLLLSFDDLALNDKDCQSEAVIPWASLAPILNTDGVISLFWQP